MSQLHLKSEQMLSDSVIALKLYTAVVEFVRDKLQAATRPLKYHVNPNALEHIRDLMKEDVNDD